MTLNGQTCSVAGERLERIKNSISARRICKRPRSEADKMNARVHRTRRDACNSNESGCAVHEEEVPATVFEHAQSMQT
jgi:hypothetical protein